MADKHMPSACPSCGGQMVIVKLKCPDCGTEVSGEFEMCPVCRLDDALRELFDLFMKARGNLKQVQRDLAVSYPTARQKIEKMFRELESRCRGSDSKTVLSRLKKGEISVEEAEQMLRQA